MAGKRKFILGISDSRYDSGIALVSIDKAGKAKVELLLNEERLTRKKLQGGMPIHCLKKVFELIRPEQISELVFAGFTTPNILNRVLNKGLHHPDYNQGLLSWLENLYSKKLGMVFIKPNTMPGRIISGIAPFLLKKNLPGSLKKKKLFIYEHHQCHAASAYYTRPYTRPAKEFKNCLVITADGMGDGLSLTVSIGKNGLQRVWSADAQDSLGEFYTFITALLGFQPHHHEGKVTGLAAYGDASKVKVKFPFSLKINDSLSHPPVLSFNKKFGLGLAKEYSGLLAPYNKKDIAAWVQHHTEALMLELVRFFIKKYNLRNLCLAGGLFSNVKLNQRIMELPEVNQVYVFPHMGDGGLALGGVLAHLNHNQLAVNKQTNKGIKIEKEIKIKKEIRIELKNLFLGLEYEDEVLTALKKSGLRFEKKNNLHKHIAYLLSKGFIVARYTGRSEYGPRALGNRSVLAPATDQNIKHQLNAMLRRTSFMPFAPVLLEEHAKHDLMNYDKAKFASKFMSISFDCKKESAKAYPAAVHVDRTARPQVVIQEDDIDTYEILKEYYRLTGIPAIINTSFNIHEEPIVETPTDAIRAFLQARIPFLAINDYLVFNRNIKNRTLKKPD